MTPLIPLALMGMAVLVVEAPDVVMWAAQGYVLFLVWRRYQS